MSQQPQPYLPRSFQEPQQFLIHQKPIQQNQEPLRFDNDETYRSELKIAYLQKMKRIEDIINKSSELMNYIRKGNFDKIIAQKDRYKDIITSDDEIKDEHTLMIKLITLHEYNKFYKEVEEKQYEKGMKLLNTNSNY